MKFLIGSMPTLADVKLIFDKLKLFPDVNSAEDAKLRPKTSFVVVRLAPSCSTSCLCPKESVVLFFLPTSHFPESPNLNFVSLNPYAPYP